MSTLQQQSQQQQQQQQQTQPSSTTTRASSHNHNHNHTRTPATACATQGHSGTSQRLQHTNTHMHTNAYNSTPISPSSTPPNNNLAHRLDMHLLPTPPAASDDISNGGGDQVLVTPAQLHMTGTTINKTPRTPPSTSSVQGKFGTLSPCVPTFASVVSARSPSDSHNNSSSTSSSASLQHTSTSTSNHNHKHKQQEQAHSAMGDNSISILSSTTPSSDSPKACSEDPFNPPENGRHNNFSINEHIKFSTNTNDNASNNFSITSNNSGTGNNSNETEDTSSSSDSSDVEIYLNTLGLHDSAARMHVFGAPVGTSSISSERAAPIRPSACSGKTMTLGRSPRLSPPSGAAEPTATHFGGQLTSNALNANKNTTNNIRLQPTPADLSNTKSLSPLSFALSPNEGGSGGSPPQLRSLKSLAGNGVGNGNGNGTNPICTERSPKVPPPAPVHSTIPLPDEGSGGGGSSGGGDYLIEEDKRQLAQLAQHQHQHQHQQQFQQQHQQRQEHQQEQLQQLQSPISTSTVHDANTIDLAGLTISGGDPAFRGHPTHAHPHQHQHQLGIPTSLSQPILTVEPSFDSPTSGGTLPMSISDSALSAGAGGGAGGTGGVGQGQKTPNVYINGLPPHFREDQLFDLTCPFGAIRSVRTFTRHVRDSESGYGFVLFETIEAAERCIISLRRYRNLHPTFSKQIHKIPGTTYAQDETAPSSTSTNWNEHGLDSDSGSNMGSNTDSLGQEASFKAKMESLQDPTSTNLYMEGLPLSLDEPTLVTLVAPHVISSCRFFHTRLSNPPRIIAFVRLETRKGAEEIIERLHGRMVRGWNDTGSRISVRFADTSEQRELRKTERAAQEGDGSPARLTIAQAALLNLRGNELGPGANSTGSVIHAQRGYGGASPRGDVGLLPSPTVRGFSASVSAPDFASNVHLMPPVGGELEVDYSLAPGRGLSGAGSRSRSPYQMQQGMMGYQSHDPYAGAGAGVQVPGQTGYALSPTMASASMDPAMEVLINSLRSNSSAYHASALGGYDSGNGEYVGGGNQMGRGMGHVQQHPPIGLHHQHQQHHHHLATSQSMDNLQQYSRPGPAYTRSGYTATEEYIMRAHAESTALAQQAAVARTQERRRPTPLDLRRRREDEEDPERVSTNIAVGMRGYRAQASVGRLGQGLMSSSSIGSLTSPTSVGVGSMGGMGMGMGSLGDNEYHASVRNEFGRVTNSNVGESDGINRTVGGLANVRGYNPNIHPAHVNVRLARDPPPSAPSFTRYSQIQQRSPLPSSPSISGAPQTNSDFNSAVNANSNSNQQESSPSINQTISYQHAAAHLRSTTLPQHRTSSAREGQQIASGRGHYQHSSMSIPALNLMTPQHASVSAFGGAGGIEGAGTIYEDRVREDQQQPQQSQPQQQQQSSEANGNGNNVIGSSKIHYSPSAQNIFGEMETSPTTSLISPTLTYGTQTPSTLSPATPFFGSFNSQGEGFEKGTSTSGIEGQNQKQQAGSGSAVGPMSLRS